jgi:hypothetical protein
MNDAISCAYVESSEPRGTVANLDAARVVAVKAQLLPPQCRSLEVIAV